MFEILCFVNLNSEASLTFIVFVATIKTILDNWKGLVAKKYLCLKKNCDNDKRNYANAIEGSFSNNQLNDYLKSQF